MKKYFLILLILLLQSNLFSQSFGCYNSPLRGGPVISGGQKDKDSLFWNEYEDSFKVDGYQTIMRNKYQLKMKGTVLNRQKEGLWSLYEYENNSVIIHEVYFRKNKKNGAYRVFEKKLNDTILNFTGNFINDKRNGEFIYFNTEGQKTLIENFSNGKLNGDKISYMYSEGNQYIEKVTKYKDGENTGIEKEFKINKKNDYYLFKSITNNDNGVAIETLINSYGDTLKKSNFNFINNTLSEITFNTKGDTLTIKIYEYSTNKFNNLIYSAKFVKNKKLVSYSSLNGESTTNKFSDKGDTIQMNHKNLNSGTGYYKLFKQDSKNKKWLLDKHIDYTNNFKDFNYRKYYNNGKLKQEIIYKDSLLQTITEYDSINGNKLNSGNYNNGNGTLILHFSNGNISSTFNYFDYKAKGDFINYYENGKIEVKGELFSSINLNYNNSLVIIEMGDINLNYLNNSLEGEIESFGLKGEKIANIKLDTLTGVTTFTYYDENEIVKTKFNKKNKKRIGHYIYYNQNGSPETEGYYDSLSNKSGQWKYYYENGNLQSIENFEKGIQKGRSEYYEDNGILKRIYIINDDFSEINIFNGDTVNRIDSKGLKQGKWIDFPYINNETKCQIDKYSVRYFKDSKPIGTWIVYQPFYSKRYSVEKWIDNEIAYTYDYLEDEEKHLLSEGEIVNGNYKFGIWKYYKKQEDYLEMSGEYYNNQKVGIWNIYNEKGEIIATEDLGYPNIEY